MAQYIKPQDVQDGEQRYEVVGVVLYLLTFSKSLIWLYESTQAFKATVFLSPWATISAMASMVQNEKVAVYMGQVG